MTRFPFPRATRLLAPVVLTAFLGACAQTDVHHLEASDLGRELTLVGAGSQPVVRNADGSLCFGPPPDAAIDVGAGAQLKMVGAGAMDNELPLGGRNPNVLITRDILFQSCMAEARLGLSGDERVKLFRETLGVVKAVNTSTLEGASITTDADSGQQTIPAVPVPGTAGGGASGATSSGSAGGGSSGGGSSDGDFSWD